VSFRDNLTDVKSVLPASAAQAEQPHFLGFLRQYLNVLVKNYNQ